jgi:uncharacterized membrane protein
VIGAARDADATAASPVSVLRSRLTAWSLDHRWALVVCGVIAGWSAVLFATVRSDYVDYRLARFDLGNMVQAVWSTAHGRPLDTTVASGEQAVRLASHVDPILVLLAPLWIIFPSPLTLAGVQIAAVALGALPVFWLARRHLESERAASLLALAYLAYPWFAWTAVDAMHPVTLAIPLFLFALYLLDTDRLWPFAVCAVLVLATGELMGVVLAALGIWYWISRGQRRAGLAIAACSLAWTAFCLEVVIPHFRGEESAFYDRFASVGGSPGGILETALTSPGTILSALTSGDDLSYILWLGAPLVGIFVLTPALAAVALPQLLVNALSDWPTTTDPRHHYVAGIAPFLIGATVFAVARVRRPRRALAATLILAVSLGFSLLLGPWPGAPGARPVAFHAKLPATHVDALRNAAALLPDEDAVSATNTIGSHLSARRSFYSVPVVADAEWIVLDTWDTWMPPASGRKEGFHPEVMRRFRDRTLASSSWRLVFEQDGVLLFERVDR